jgi:hypothetical protein
MAMRFGPARSPQFVSSFARAGGGGALPNACDDPTGTDGKDRGYVGGGDAYWNVATGAFVTYNYGVPGGFVYQ